jgi:hypothetical protein
VDLEETDVSEKRIASINMVTRISDLGTMLAVTINPSTLRRIAFLRTVLRLLVTANVVPRRAILVTPVMVAIGSSETSVRIRFTWHEIPEDGNLHSHRRENLK